MDGVPRIGSDAFVALNGAIDAAMDRGDIDEAIRLSSLQAEELNRWLQAHGYAPLDEDPDQPGGARGGQMGSGSRPVRLPPGYPKEYRQLVTLRDGRMVLIRPILPSDAPELGEAIRTADPDTLRRRFLGGPPRVTCELLAHLTVLDYQRRFALVAIDTVTGRGVGIARYEPAGEGVAELAVAVRPAWRRVGLATTLILFLAKAAAERGIHTFTASYLAENRPIAALAEDAGGLGKQIIQQGFAEFTLALDRRPAKSPDTNGAESG